MGAYDIEARIYDKSEWGIALTGYVVPGCVEDGTWMLWENSSAAVGVVLARSLLDKFSKKSSYLDIFIKKWVSGTFIFKKVVFQLWIFAEGTPPRRLVLLFLRKYAYVNKKSSFIKLTFLVKNCHFWLKNSNVWSFFLKGRFFPKNFRRRHASPSFSACFDNFPYFRAC